IRKRRFSKSQTMESLAMSFKFSRRSPKKLRNSRVNKLFLSLSLFAVGFGCAGAKLSPDVARDAIAKDLALSKEQVKVENVGMLLGNATVEANLKLSFILQQRGGEWHVYKVQSSNNAWQTPQQFQESLRAAFNSELNHKEPQN